MSSLKMPAMRQAKKATLVHKAAEKALLARGYKHNETLKNAGGLMNESIMLVENLRTHKTLICKNVQAGDAEDQVEMTARLIGGPNVIQMYDYSFSEGDKENVSNTDYGFDRIFLEYCDMGTLQTVLKKHSQSGVKIPESFIWHVIESLAKALEFCHNGRGGAPGSHQDSKTWVPIIHMDINPGNVFLSSPTKATSPHPYVVLGDFGAAREKPLEITTASKYTISLQEAMDEPVDIYHFGGLIKNMCRCTIPRKEFSGFGLDADEPWLYSSQLQILVERCIAADRSLRPTAQELSLEIGEMTKES
jgi:serine/threonine protein kinase